jgi:hypothetical protein
MRLAGGIDDLNLMDKDFGLDENGRIKLGETVSNGKGGRTISITDIGDLDTMSVVLGHEAYRDGVVGADNKQETRDAVIAHTKMAARMREEDSDFNGSFVGLDLAAYDRALSTGNMGIMDEYADAMYDSSGDFWKLTKDEKLIKDGFARVVDKNGKVIISLKDLGMTEDQQYDDITSLARMFGISNEKATEINEANNGSIQLGYGAGIGEDDYVNALRYALNNTNVNNIGNSMFNWMTTDKRAEYLKRQVIVGSAFIGEDKGTLAEKLRNLDGLHNESILTGLFYTKIPANSKGNYEKAANYDFMNKPLREFLNLNSKGSSQYTMDDISGKGFSDIGFLKSFYHLDPNYSNIKKYTHADGREVIWGLNKRTNEYEQINSELYRGTFNYSEAETKNIAKKGPHYMFDMRPFDEEYGTSVWTSIGSARRYSVTKGTDIIGKTLSNGVYDVQRKVYNALDYFNSSNPFIDIYSHEYNY